MLSSRCLFLMACSLVVAAYGAGGGSWAPPPPPAGGEGSVSGAVVVGSGAAQAAAATLLPTRPERARGRRRYVPDELLVRFRAGVRATEARAVHARAGGTVTRTIPGIGVDVVRVPSSADVDQAVSAYRGSAIVESVERNAYVYAAAGFGV